MSLFFILETRINPSFSAKRRLEENVVSVPSERAATTGHGGIPRQQEVKLSIKALLAFCSAPTWARPLVSPQ